jgi:hypothetical protein
MDWRYLQNIVRSKVVGQVNGISKVDSKYFNWYTKDMLVCKK